MRYIFLIAAFNAFFYTVLMIRKKKALHDKILIGWLIYLGICTGGYALFSDILFNGYQILSAAFISLLLLHGPFLYLYISALINDRFRFKLISLYHFIPFLLFNLYLFISLFFTRASVHISLDHVETASNTPLLFNLFLILTVLSGPVYFVLTLNKFKELNINIFNNFSAPENVNPDWLKKLVYSFGTVWTLLMVAASLHHVFHFYTLEFCADSLFLALSVFVILIGYFGLKQKEIFIHYHDGSVDEISEPKAKYAGILLKEGEAEELADNIERFMEKEKPYLVSDLTLPDLANRLNVPPHHLSRVINETLGLNFFEFVNRYRIKEVKDKMMDPEFINFSLLGIAYESGFNTKSAFNRVFKKLTGMTPSAYKKQI